MRMTTRHACRHVHVNQKHMRQHVLRSRQHVHAHLQTLAQVTRPDTRPVNSPVAAGFIEGQRHTAYLVHARVGGVLLDGLEVGVQRQADARGRPEGRGRYWRREGPLLRNEGDKALEHIALHRYVVS